MPVTFDRDIRRIQNAKEGSVASGDSKNIVSHSPAVRTMSDGEQVFAQESNKPLTLYKKNKGALWKVALSKDGNQIIEKNLEVKGRIVSNDIRGSVGATSGLVLDSTGVVMIGRSTPLATTKDPLLEVDGLVSFDGFMSRAGQGGSDDDDNYMNFYWDGSYIDGWVDTTEVWPNETSDYRIKENVTDVSDGVLDKINELRPIHYTQKECGIFKKFDDQRVSFIAHELEEHFPDIVKGDKDAVDDNGDPVFQSYNNTRLTAYLIKAVQELSAKVTALENN